MTTDIRDLKYLIYDLWWMLPEDDVETLDADMLHLLHSVIRDVDEQWDAHEREEAKEALHPADVSGNYPEV